MGEYRWILLNPIQPFMLNTTQTPSRLSVYPYDINEGVQNCGNGIKVIDGHRRSARISSETEDLGEDLVAPVPWILYSLDAVRRIPWDQVSTHIQLFPSQRGTITFDGVQGRRVWGEREFGSQKRSSFSPFSAFLSFSSGVRFPENHPKL